MQGTPMRTISAMGFRSLICAGYCLEGPTQQRRADHSKAEQSGTVLIHEDADVRVAGHLLNTMVLLRKSLQLTPQQRVEAIELIELCTFDINLCCGGMITSRSPTYS